MKFHALDTETLNRAGGGHAVLVGYHGAPFYLESPKTFPEIFDYLEGRNYVAWNMDFDFRAIFHKRYIPIKTLESLGFLGWSIWGDYEIEYIPRKLFSIRNLKTKKSFRLYDLKQFYDASLAVAASKFLSQDSQKQEIPKAWYNEIDRCLQDRRRPKVLAYFESDLKSCQALSDKLLSSYSLIGLEPKALFSAGFLSYKKFKEIFAAERLIDSENSIFKRSFFGGRVEFLKLGNFKRISLYDVRSAYPWIISGLLTSKGARISSAHGEWRDRGDCYGFYRIKAFVPPKFKIGPLAYRLKGGKIIYPVGEFEALCGNPAIKCLQKFGIKFEVLEAYEIFPDSPEKIFGSKIHELFLKRKIKGFDLACKKTLNSVYGKFAEKGQYTQKMNQYLAGRKIKPPSSQFGRGTNYALAGHITESIRIHLWETAQKIGEKNVIGFATDGIFCEKSKLKTGNNLGDWGHDSLNDFTVLGCGRYVWQSETGIKSKFRGTELSPEIIAQLKKSNKKEIAINRLKTKTLRRWADDSEGDLNVLDFEEKIFALEDEKREWPEIKSFKEIFAKNFNSRPLTISNN